MLSENPKLSVELIGIPDSSFVLDFKGWKLCQDEQEGLRKSIQESSVGKER